MPVRALSCFTVVMLLAGCGVSQSKLDQASAHVGKGLETWKNGGKPSDLMAGDTPVEFHEAMWNAGDTLVSYEMGRVTYNKRDQVFRCEVQLTVRPRKGKQKIEKVVYDVKLDAPVKVLNNPMP